MEQMLAEGSPTTSARHVPEQRVQQRTGRGRGPLRPRSRWLRALTALGLSAGVAAGALGGVAASSTDALPGYPLYGMKRGIEDLQLDLADGDTERGKAYLALASRRLQEVRGLMEHRRDDPPDDKYVSELRTTLLDLRQEASEGRRLLVTAYRKDGSQEPIETLSAFFGAHHQDWTEVRDRLPAQIGDVASQVTVVFDAIEHAVTPRRTPPTADSSPAHVPRFPAQVGETPAAERAR
jgi:hypothetical protein